MTDTTTFEPAARLFPSPEFPTVPVNGESAVYPVHRIFCVGRNYAEHAKEMGVEVDREAPFYFTKSPLAIVPTGATVPYPAGTENYHYEMELVDRHRRAGLEGLGRGRAEGDPRLCDRPRHDPPRPAARRPCQAAALGPRQGLREVGGDRAGHPRRRLRGQRPGDPARRQRRGEAGREALRPRLERRASSSATSRTTITSRPAT